MPPFAGEGMCAAIRDVFNLAWRLDLVLQGTAGDALLDEWSNERREQAKWYIDFSVNLGRIICVTDEAEAAERDKNMIADYVPGKTADPHAAVLGEGTWDNTNELAGKPSFQGVVAYRGKTGRFDDAVGRGWFLLTTKAKEGEKLSDAQLAAFAHVGGAVLTVGPRGSGADVIDLDGTYATFMTDQHITHMLLRPDYYVAVTANSESELRRSFDSVMTHVVAA